MWSIQSFFIYFHRSDRLPVNRFGHAERLIAQTHVRLELNVCWSISRRVRILFLMIRIFYMRSPTNQWIGPIEQVEHANVCMGTPCMQQNMMKEGGLHVKWWCQHAWHITTQLCNNLIQLSSARQYTFAQKVLMPIVHRNYRYLSMHFQPWVASHCCICWKFCSYSQRWNSSNLSLPCWMTMRAEVCHDFHVTVCWISV